MKKTIALFLCCAATAVLATQEDDVTAKRMAWEKSYLEKQGLPAPDGGIKVIPEKEMRTYAQRKEERAKIKKDIEKFGYINQDSPSTMQLIDIKITAHRDLKHYVNDFDPRSTHLKISPNQLKMAYTPTIVPPSVANEYLGAAPYLTYLKDQGWVGAIQFFVNEEAGNCSFSENNIKLSHGSVILAKEDVKYDVNGKETLTNVIGTPEGGFTYSVEWFDATFFRKVECATKRFSPEVTSKIIEIAKIIDKA